MSKLFKLLYSPALRMKAGELEGMRQLTAEVADCILPRLIVPPSGERDDSTLLLMNLERIPDISTSLARVWRHRPVLVDATYILDEFGRDLATRWLPAMFEHSRKKDVRAIPAAYIDDIECCSEAYYASIDKSDLIKFCIIVSSNDIVGSDLPEKIRKILSKLDVTASDCVAIVDFANVEFSEPEIVSPIIRFALETLQDIGLWQKIIFQGSHYPDKNPAPEEGGFFIHPRNEWVAWRLAVKFDPSTADHMVFGDYAADCSKIEFLDGGGKPIPHLRYTINENFLVQRGVKRGKNHDSIHQVYSAIVRSQDFAGAHFSKADKYIAIAASNIMAPHGNATTWRQLNTTHHLTQVVGDIALVRGVEIKPSPVEQIFVVQKLL